MNDDQRRQLTLVQALQDPARYLHPADRVDLIETHISYVLLAGEYAYKLKKTVDLGFLDFSTLERRRFFCQEELRLNGRLAPDIYLAVACVTGSAEDPTMEGSGAAMEYAVKMRRFDQANLLNHLLERGALGVERIDEMADRVAAFHGSIAAAGADSEFGDPDVVIQPIRENFRHLEPLLETAHTAEQLRRIRQWTEERFTDLKADMGQRKSTGMVRECHGDMHLANMTVMDGRLEIFDGIEFNPALRWIDVMSDIAFLTMDLEDRGAPHWSHRLRNHYLERTGDYHGVVLLRFYQVYRAMVRAKVASIRLHQAGIGAQEKAEVLETCRSYTDLAERYTWPRQPALVITHGFSGAGKTALTASLLEALDAIRVRSDIERKRLAHLAPTDRSNAEIDRGLYAQGFIDRTYAYLAEQVRSIITGGWSAIVDATFLNRTHRDQFARLAARLQVPFLILDFQAEQPLLRERLRARTAHDTDASDAGLAVLAHQLAHHDPLAAEEPVMSIDSTKLFDPDAVKRRLFG